MSKNSIYTHESLRPFFFGILAYQFKWRDEKIRGYFGYGHRYGYKKLIGNVFLLKRYKP